MNTTRLGPSSLRTRVREEQKHAILASAEEVFAASGLQAGRMDLVAARAGVSVGTLYNYFGDRESLLRTLLATRREELLESIDRAIAKGPEDFHGRLRAFLNATFQHCREHRGFLSLFLQEEAEGLKAKLSPPRGQRTLELLQARAAAIAKQGIAEGLLREGSPDLYSRLLVGVMHAAMAEQLAPNAEAAERDFATETYEFFLNGAAAPAKGNS